MQLDSKESSRPLTKTNDRSSKAGRRMLSIVLQLTMILLSSDVPEYSSIIGGEVELPCNVTPPSYDDNVLLVLWYRGDSGSPIYTVDARSSPLELAKHFTVDELGSRAVFNTSARNAILHISPVEAIDGGEYRCRVDFKRGRTQTKIMMLNVIVPPGEVYILNEQGERLPEIIGPVNEGTSLNLTCEATGG